MLHSALYSQAGRKPNGLQAFPVSAKTGAGLDELRRGIEQLLIKARRTVRLAVESSRPDAMAWLYENAEVLGSGLDHNTNVVHRRNRHGSAGRQWPIGVALLRPWGGAAAQSFSFAFFR